MFCVMLCPQAYIRSDMNVSYGEGTKVEPSSNWTCSNGRAGFFILVLNGSEERASAKVASGRVAGWQGGRAAGRDLLPEMF